ncbi:MAG: hypothetical protein JXR64_13705 [Spirochaetales bacterium]|nr:hypothetical protein [Spirochaetales bacterium]
MKYNLVDVLKNRFIDADGKYFQEIFYEIMRAKYATDFVMPRNYGKIGDYKCDGISINEGFYYAIYSPENPNFRDENQKYAIGKVRKDIKGFLEQYEKGTWEYKCSKFIFVYNAKFNKQPPAPILSELSKLDKKVKEKFPEITVSYMTQYDLELAFIELKSEQQEFIINHTYCGSEEIDFDASSIALILDKMHMTDFKSVEVHDIMGMKEKIKFNKLDENRAGDLLKASYNIMDFKDFIRRTNPEYIQFLQDRCLTLYDEAKTILKTNSNKQFDYILENLYSYDIKQVNSNEAVYKSIKNNKLIIMSMFFENCSIFESI